MDLTIFIINAEATYREFDNIGEWTGTISFPTVNIAAKTRGDAIADYIKLARAANPIRRELTFHPYVLEVSDVS